jgi:hypothetical protein
MDEGKAQRIRPGTLGILFLPFVCAILLSHSQWLDLPYFWDEAGYYIPAALDFFHGSPIPHSVPPLIHPPGLPLYLATVWSFAGFHPEATRCAMLLLAAAAGMFGLLLSIELLREARGMPGFFAAALVCLSPVFFAQSILAQPDMPAMLFTTLALWFFLRGRIVPAAAACAVLVMVKETGFVAPAVFAFWLAYERRWREAAWFLAPLAVLGAWIATLFHITGQWAGDAHFVDYNLYYSLHPLRVAVNGLRRVYYLFFANLHWVGTFAILFAWRTTRLFHSRNWRIATTFGCAHVAAVTLLGGAALERYLLPVLPILYAAMAASLSLFPRKPRLICSGALLAGLTAGIFLNPPYPFPYEDNRAFADFVRLQGDAADYVRHWYSGARVTTIWPMTIELSRPELGYVDRRPAVESLPDLSPATWRGIEWDKVQVLVAFSRNWDPAWSPLRVDLVARIWHRIFGYAPFASEEELRQSAPFPAAAEWRRHGQWVDIYVNPRQPLTPQPAKPLRAAR